MGQYYAAFWQVWRHSSWTRGTIFHSKNSQAQEQVPNPQGVVRALRTPEGSAASISFSSGFGYLHLGPALTQPSSPPERQSPRAVSKLSSPPTFERHLSYTTGTFVPGWSSWPCLVAQTHCLQLGLASFIWTCLVTTSWGNDIMGTLFT